MSWSDRSPSSPLELGVLLGRLLERSERSTALLEEIRDHVVRPGPWGPASPPAPPRTPILPLLREIILAAIPLALLAGIAAGKVTFSEALPLLRQVLLP